MVLNTRHAIILSAGFVIGCISLGLILSAAGTGMAKIIYNAKIEISANSERRAIAEAERSKYDALQSALDAASISRAEARQTMNALVTAGLLKPVGGTQP